MFDPDLILPLMILGGCVLFFIIAPFVAKKDQKKAFEELDETVDAESEIRLPEPDVIGARVIKKRVGGRHSGGKVSKYSVHFSVTFLTEDGEELEFEVSQEIFDKISEGQVGSLVTINGNFFDFGDGEDVAEEQTNV